MNQHDGRRPRSMTLRLGALYTASALVILLVSAVVLDVALARELRAEDIRLLVAKAGELRQAARRFPGRPELMQEEVVFEPAAPRLEPYFARIVAPDGTTLLETTGMARLLPASRFPIPSRALQPVLVELPAARSFLLYAAPLDDGEGSGARRLQVALDVTHDAAVLRGYRTVLLLVVLVGALLSGLAGYWIPRRGLRPLRRITAAAKEVSATRLDRRISGSAWPAELVDLAGVFDQMLDGLQDAFGRLTRFSADLAHELRTPLTNLRGEAEVALRHERPPEAYREVVASALEEYGRLTDLVDRLLFLARAEAGALAPAREALDLGEVLEDVCDYYRPLAEDTGVEIACHGDGTLHADPLLLRQALGNLLANALAHTPAGGQVRLETVAEAEAVRITVADTGGGIAPEHLPHVFERFYQADPAREGRMPGAGLGLPLVRTIAQLHGGTVTLDSRPAQGTTVVLEIPRDTA